MRVVKWIAAVVIILLLGFACAVAIQWKEDRKAGRESTIVDDLLEWVQGFGQTDEDGDADSEGEDSDRGSIFDLFSGKKTLHFWYQDESMTNFYNGAAVAFGKEHDVRVLPVLVEEGEYLEAVNEATLHGKELPDVYVLGNEYLEKAYLAGLASPIEDAAGVVNEENFHKAALSAITYRGKKVAYPLSYETSALVYNATYLEEFFRQMAERAGTVEHPGGEDGQTEAMGPQESPAQKYADGEVKAPRTVEDILFIAENFDVPEGVEAIMKWDVSDIFYNYWFVGEYMVVGGDSGDDAQNIVIDSPEAIKCLEVYESLKQFFSIESDTVDYNVVVQDFLEGKTVFTIATTDMVSRLTQAKEEGSIAWEFGVAPMPEISDTLKSRSLSVTKTVAVNGYSQEKELANAFAAYLTEECTKELYAHTGKLAARRTPTPVAELSQVFCEEYEESIPLPKLMATGNYWIQLEALFARVWNGGNIAELVNALSEQIINQVNTAWAE